MIASDRDSAARRRIDKQYRGSLSRRDRVEKVQLETEQIVSSKRRCEDYVEIGHAANYSRGGPLHPPETPSGFRTSRLQNKTKTRDYRGIGRASPEQVLRGTQSRIFSCHWVQGSPLPKEA